MTKAVATLVLCCITRALNPPDVTWGGINEITDLYRDGQYEVVKVKLVNQGFVVSQSEPAYTLNGRIHEGVFVMTCDAGTWHFSTQKTANSTERDIYFSLSDRHAVYTYANSIDYWQKVGLTSDTLLSSPGQRNRRFWGEIGGAPSGYLDYVRASYSYSPASQTYGNRFEAQVIGSLRYERVKKEFPKKSRAASPHLKSIGAPKPRR